ncbi:MAG: hypothetical protein MK111_13705 [Crocosphaera sp.]|uniref:hypothetical protein n=1 Tax=Crocosphaera sp. TaxID=2729996 RepID=UPI002585E1C1|nr:hypothetical protein [Crocosphaera sp.]MCH2245675.1 hypothetical protein [Crocosphaera sp.]
MSSLWKTFGIAIGVAVAAGVAIAVIAYLTYDKFIQWFRDRLDFMRLDPDRLGFSKIQQHLDTGNYTVVRGVFDQETQEVLAIDQQEAKNIDLDILHNHDEDGLAVWHA